MKICSIKGCENQVFGGGYCKYHQYKRVDIKKSIPKRSKKKMKEKKSEIILFDSIYDRALEKNGGPRCFLTGMPIYYQRYTSLWFSIFAHILNKKDYPEYRYNEENIFLLLPEIHHVYDNPDLNTIIAYEKKYGVSFDKLFREADNLRERYIRETGKKRHQRKFVDQYRNYLQTKNS